MENAHKLDKSVPIPLYFQLKTILLEDIREGRYAINSMIPTEKELSETYGVSRITVRQAIIEMVREGWLYRIAGKGTFVARSKLNQDFIKRIEPFNVQIERTGHRPSTQLLTMTEGKMPRKVCMRFKTEIKKDFIYIHRRRFADQDPIVTVETWLPADRCAFILERDLERESMYAVLSEDVNTRICRVTRVLEAVPAGVDDVKMLGMRRGAPIQLSATIGYNRANEPIEYSIARYRGDRNRFEVDLLIDTGV